MGDDFGDSGDFGDFGNGGDDSGGGVQPASSTALKMMTDSNFNNISLRYWTRGDVAMGNRADTAYFGSTLRARLLLGLL